MKHKIKKLAKRAAAVIFTAACLICLYLPFLSKISGGEIYQCVWADGSVTEESYSSAYRSLSGADGESVLLSRNGQTGRIESEAGAVYKILERGTLAELLSCTVTGTRIDSAALYRVFSDRVWYNGSYFVWTGEKIKRVSRAERKEIVFLEGNVSSRILQEINAETVYLRADASVAASSFIGSDVKRVYAQAPYSESGGAVYLDTAGGKRLLAATRFIKELTADADLAFADEGALLACDSLVSLSLPFLGSANSPFGLDYRGELAHLFSDGRGYRVPETLSRVEVTGGRIKSFAFYGCPDLREIDVCKVSPDEISKTAFAGLKSLELLHTPKSDVLLTGNFTSRTAECGCTIYTRE